MELNRLLLKIVLLCQADIQKSSRKGNAKFNFLGMIWESIFLEGAFSRLSKSLKSKILATGCHLQVLLGLLQTSRFELLVGGWNVWYWKYCQLFVAASKCLNDCNVYLSLPPENIRKPYAKNWLKTVYAVFLKPVFWDRKIWKEYVILRCKNSYIIFRDLTPISHEDIEKNKTN